MSTTKKEPKKQQSQCARIQLTPPHFDNFLNGCYISSALAHSIVSVKRGNLIVASASNIYKKINIKCIRKNTLNLSCSSDYLESVSTLNGSKFEVDFWKLLRIFGNKIRVEIARLLLQFEMLSLSDIARELEGGYGRKMTLPGLLKHIKALEDAGIVQQESGAFLPTPDARKAIYLLEGKERVEKILQQLEDNIGYLLLAGAIFSETAKLARKLLGTGHRLAKDERKRLESLLAQCESEKVYSHLTDDEKKKVKLWRMIMTFLES